MAAFSMTVHKLILDRDQKRTQFQLVFHAICTDMKLLTLLLAASIYFVVPNTSRDILKKMHDHYYGKQFKTLTFNQTTENYRNDSLVKTSAWYEAIQYPNHFRIDFGDPHHGNGVIFSKDSAYNFRNGKLAKVTVNTDDLTFLLGGMYFYSFEKVLPYM